MHAFNVDAIVAALTGAAIGATDWDAALETLAKETNSFGSVIFPVKGSLPYVPATRSMGAAFEVYVRDGWIDRDERYRGFQKFIQNGVVTDRDVMSEENIRRNPFYQEFNARFDLTDWAATRIGTGDQIWSMTLHRNSQDERFSLSELRTLRRLSQCLGGVAETASAFGYARGDAALSAFDVAGKAALLFNRRGEVVRINQQAETLLDADLTIIGKRLCSLSKAATKSFETALRRLLWSAEVAAVPAMAFPRQGRGPVIAYLMRSFQITDSPLSAFHALAVLVDTDATSSPSVAALQTAFALTKAEARLAIALQGGADLQSEAYRLKVSVETVRKQLKSIFDKTGARRQSHLVAVLSRFLPKS